MKIYSYILARDYGFAPNPFHRVCTLATCKPKIRNPAKIGDWVIGVGSNEEGSLFKGKLIFAMEVTEKLAFNEYWNDERFDVKKPIMNGSNKQFFGDNIYHKENNIWIQENSHHSLQNGKPNLKNLERDTSSEFVLISNNFYYFGKKAISIPPKFDIVYEDIGIGHISDKIPPEVRHLFISWLVNETPYHPGYHGDPILFEDIERYSGD